MDLSIPFRHRKFYWKKGPWVKTLTVWSTESLLVEVHMVLSEGGSDEILFAFVLSTSARWAGNVSNGQLFFFAQKSPAVCLYQALAEPAMAEKQLRALLICWHLIWPFMIWVCCQYNLCVCVSAREGVYFPRTTATGESKLCRLFHN